MRAAQPAKLDAGQTGAAWICLTQSQLGGGSAGPQNPISAGGCSMGPGILIQLDGCGSGHLELNAGWAEAAEGSHDLIPVREGGMEPYPSCGLALHHSSGLQGQKCEHCYCSQRKEFGCISEFVNCQNWTINEYF